MKSLDEIKKLINEAVDCYEQDNNDDRTKVYKQAMRDFLEIIENEKP